MSDILETIRDASRADLDAAKKRLPFAELLSTAEKTPRAASFKNALRARGGNPAVIAEMKKASPSAGLIRADFEPSKLCVELESAGASALSVLTERNYFLGSLEFLRDAATRVKIPLLRKDFIFDEYQIAEAKAAGASAVLLIAKMLKKPDFKRLFDFAKSLSLDVLAEAHDEAEIEAALDCGADIVGVNCRNLRTFGLDFSVSERLLKTLPDGVVKVAESGVDSRETLLRARGAGADAALVGTALMKEQSPSEALKKLLGAL